MEKNEVSLPQNKKVIEVLKDENFIAQLNDALNVEEIRSVFSSKGIEISLDKAEVIKEALISVNERIQNTDNTEIVTDEELNEIAGGGSVIRKALELVFMCTVIAEGVRISKKVMQKGGANEKILDVTNKGKNALIAAEDKVVNWISGK